MNLDALDHVNQLDSQDMLAQIESLPDQLALAYELGLTQPLPDWMGVRHLLIAGMGVSALCGDLLAAYLKPFAPMPVTVHRDYGLPFWARGEDVLVVASSHSGNTEEVLDAFDTARANGCRILAISTGGELADRAVQADVPLWIFPHHGPSRPSLSYSFGFLLALAERIGLVPSQVREISIAIEAMKQVQEHLRVDVPIVQNPAKRQAGQLMGRWVSVVGGGIMAPAAVRIKNQINTLARAGANVEILPEANHNTIAGLMQPEAVLMPHTITLFLRASSEHSRNRLRTKLTQNAYMVEGLNTDFMDARGDTPLAQLWTMILFGDYLAYYLALAYDIDPSGFGPVDDFKQILPPN